MRYLILSSVLFLFSSCAKQSSQEVILKNLFKEEFNYQLPDNAVIITLPTESCPGCNANATQCYRKIHYKPEVIAICTDTMQIGSLSGIKRVFWDKNKVITKYQIGQQPYYIEFKDGKIISMMEFSKQNQSLILKKVEKL